MKAGRTVAGSQEVEKVMSGHCGGDRLRQDCRKQRLEEGAGSEEGSSGAAAPG